MKRPLAFAGLLYLIIQLLAAFLPSAAITVLAALFVLLFFVCIGRRKLPHRVPLLLGCGVAAVACLFHLAYRQTEIMSRQTLVGDTIAVRAEVIQAQPGYREGSVRATLYITHMKDSPCDGFYVSVPALPHAQQGDIVEGALSFRALKRSGYLLSAYYARGVCLAADVPGEIAITGRALGWMAAFRQMQSDMSAVLRKGMSREIGAVACAMALGDKTLLTTTQKDNYRRAGLSHILVVSGLHLAAAGASAYWLFRRLFREKAAALLTCLTLLIVMALTGITPSVVRAGVAMLTVYAGRLFLRRSDALTSLGFAALLMCLQNPYAAVDIGLLLSFSATLGVLAANGAIHWLQKQAAQISFARKVALRGAKVVAVPLATTLATLPVLISIGSGVSLLTVLCNLLALPVLSLVVCTGFVSAGAGMIVFLKPISQLCGLFCGLLVKFLNTVVACAVSVPGMFVHITGWYAFCVVLLFYALLFAGCKFHLRLRYTLCGAALFLFIACVIYGVADANAVHIAFVGARGNPAVVITQRLRTAVVYRGPDSNLADVWEYLETYNRTGVDYLLDLRTQGDSVALAESLCAKQTKSVQTDVINNAILNPFYDIIIYVRRQAEGNFACIEAWDYNIGVAQGKVDLSVYPPLDVYLAGTSKPFGLQTQVLLLPQTGYRWLNDFSSDAVYMVSDGLPRVLIRPGGLIRFDEVLYDLE